MAHIRKIRKKKKNYTIPVCLLVIVFGIATLCYIGSNCDCNACSTEGSTQACKYR